MRSSYLWLSHLRKLHFVRSWQFKEIPPSPAFVDLTIIDLLDSLTTKTGKFMPKYLFQQCFAHWTNKDKKNSNTSIVQKSVEKDILTHICLFLWSFLNSVLWNGELSIRNSNTYIVQEPAKRDILTYICLFLWLLGQQNWWSSGQER